VPAAKKKRSDAVFPANVEETSAFRYGALSSEACLREVATRALAVSQVEGTHRGLVTPMRITGPLGTVTFRTQFVGEAGEPSVYSLLDCRLVLSLDDFARFLGELDVVEVLYSSAYRPRPESAPERARELRHGGGLAVDVHRFKRADGVWLNVEKDFHGRIGAKVCGTLAKAPAPKTTAATTLRRIACGASERRLFQLVLTPNYDRPHRNHFHLEVTPDVRWYIVS
jgi:hypothetical protein